MSPIRTVLLLLGALVVSMVLSSLGASGGGRLRERWRKDLRLLGRCIAAAVAVYWIILLARLAI